MHPTATTQSCPPAVLELIERFDRNLDAYRSGRYNETQLRREFVDPLFDALGWDVQNRQGWAETYKEVVHEDAIKIGGATKAPDYSFRIGGVRKFFVETKKPSVYIKEEIPPAFQLRRYAWSAKLPLSILTDFEEFAVYDTRVRPNQNDKASTARTMYLRYTDYSERWDELAGIFSRTAILQGSFDKYAESKKKRGTADVDDAFLEEIERWRELLAKDIAKRNPELSQRELNFAVQRTLDRIVFLRIAEDRGIEEYGRLQALLNGTNVYKRLLVLFDRADERYNSGLFHFRVEKGRTEAPDELTPSLELDDKPLKQIIRGLYYPESPYEFSVLPADILGQVYERFLGKVIRLTPGHRAVVEEKPEVRKAGGVYYTPTYIVDYIVRQTVGKLVEGLKPGPRGGVSKLRILDPACGSGSFLLGAYQKLLDWHLEEYAKEPEKYGNQLAQVGEDEWRLTVDERKRILLNNIYGVDIDPQAVEVTKLSLLLKVLEGESTQTLERQMALFHTRALPDLSSNIKSGNSLIGPDFYAGKQLGLLDEEERWRINAFDWDAEFPEIMRDGGFDAVIGNPPYVVLGKDVLSEAEISYLSGYEVAQYKTDLFHLFIQRGIELLKQGGHFGYIVPNPWLTQQFTTRLRQYALEHTTIEEIVVFEHLVFGDATVHTCLLFLRKGMPGTSHVAAVKRPPMLNNAEELVQTPAVPVAQQEWSGSEQSRIETRLIGKVGALVTRLLVDFPPLDDVARASLGCQAYNRSKHTTDQIKNRVFHASERLSDEYLPELAGSDVSRYELDRQRGQWIKYGPWLHDYRTMDWLQGPRILIREITGSSPHQIQAAYTEETYCNYKTILNVNPSPTTEFSMQYLLGLLNSQLLSFLYPYTSNKMVARSFPRLSVGDLRQLPIRPIDFSNPEDAARHDRMVALVVQMLALHEQLRSAKTAHDETLLQRQIRATDREIDRMVYELYGLTEEEIGIVEGELEEKVSDPQRERRR